MTMTFERMLKITMRYFPAQEATSAGGMNSLTVHYSQFSRGRRRYKKTGILAVFSSLRIDPKFLDGGLRASRAGRHHGGCRFKRDLCISRLPGNVKQPARSKTGLDNICLK
jgi:hypothetical protein